MKKYSQHTKRYIMQKNIYGLLMITFLVASCGGGKKDVKAEVTEKIMDMPAHLSAFFDRKKLLQLLDEHNISDKWSEYYAITLPLRRWRS